MRKLALYLDTSVISFALSEDISDYDRDITLKLIDEINKGGYERFISDVVIRELGSTLGSAKRDKLLKVVSEMELNDVLFVDTKPTGWPRSISMRVSYRQFIETMLCISL